ncbi:hypothetical protein [Pseudomonas sp. NPDC089406]|uniref:hypothetical protein n=1 Tax=Pseudomonas sp. NPDC089406 TaxID=3364463 RepID=UPI00384AA490
MNPTTSTPPGASASLCMPDAMNVPGICRGALTQWPQLHAALARLATTDAAPMAAHQAGGPEQLQAALRLDPGYLTQPTPPADLYGHFVWLAVRVLKAARRFNLTLQHLPDLFSMAPGSSASERGGWVRQVLAGADGLLAEAQALTAQASAFGHPLHSAQASAQASQARWQPASVQSEPTPADNPGPALHAFSQAQARARSEQYQSERLQLSAANQTVAAAVGNMASAIETLATAWQAMVAQLQAIAAHPPAELGSLDYLRTNLALDQAVAQWGSFAGTLEQFVAGSLGSSRVIARTA